MASDHDEWLKERADELVQKTHARIGTWIEQRKAIIDFAREYAVLASRDEAPQSSQVVPARELISNYRKAVVEWCQTQTEEDFGRMVAGQKALFAALKTAPTAVPGDAGKEGR
jgi:hypothetical protein